MKLTKKQIKIIALRKIAGDLLTLADATCEMAFENSDLTEKQLEYISDTIKKEAQKYINQATALGGEFNSRNPDFNDILNQ